MTTTRELLEHAGAAMAEAITAKESSVLATTIGASHDDEPQQVSRDYLRRGKSGPVSCSVIVTVQTLVCSTGHETLYIQQRASILWGDRSWTQPLPQSVDLTPWELADLRSWLGHMVKEVAIARRVVLHA